MLEGDNRRLSLLSYNIQAGVDTQRYRQYLTQGWKQWLPHRERLLNLNRIASMIHRFDIVGLQEVDSGSLRSGFVDQTEYLAQRAGFPYWHKQINRNLGKLAQHSNGLLSKLRPREVMDHRLPGLPGRGAMLCRFGADDGGGLLVCIVHLALGARARQRQMAFLGELVQQQEHLVVMGDLNCGCDAREVRQLMEKTGLREPSCDQSTFPSWRPMHRIDHILVSQSLAVENSRVLDYPFSDHLPIGLDILLPKSLNLAA